MRISWSNVEYEERFTLMFKWYFYRNGTEGGRMWNPRTSSLGAILRMGRSNLKRMRRIFCLSWEFFYLHSGGGRLQLPSVIGSIG